MTLDILLANFGTENSYSPYCVFYKFHPIQTFQYFTEKFTRQTCWMNFKVRHFLMKFITVSEAIQQFTNDYNKNPIVMLA